MPTELLKKIARDKLPKRVVSASEIQRLRKLRDEGLVEAFLPRHDALPSDGEGFTARVTAITPKGREKLDQLEKAER